jgi:SMC interacting uncharacterized protein involved in chromosome segregation
LYLLAYLFLDLGFGELFLTKEKDKRMNEQEMKRIIEEQVNALIMLEKQIADIQTQLKILQELINELKPHG